MTDRFHPEDGAPSQPTPSKAATLVQGATKPIPLKQGELDGLCGLYAGINAIRLLVAAQAMPPVDAKALFAVGITLLVKRERLASAVLDGIPNGTWRRLLTKLAATASRTTGQRITLGYPFADRARVSRRDLFKVIEAAVDARQPIVVALSGKHEHYAVILGYTANRLVLFDSGALSWLSRRLCGPSNNRVGWEHEINTASVTVFNIRASAAA